MEVKEIRIAEIELSEFNTRKEPKCWYRRYRNRRFSQQHKGERIVESNNSPKKHR